MLNQITPVILTYNEQDNIGRTLAALAWAQDIVVVDSFSTDRTAEIVAEFPNARMLRRAFDSHAQQWNFAIAETAIATDWILALDADYVAPEDFTAELTQLVPDADCDAYDAEFAYCILGRKLRATLYPENTVLYRRGRATYLQKGHTQRLIVNGKIGRLSAKLLHDDRKPLARWLSSQQNYARLEADYLLSRPRAELRRIDRLRLMAWPAPLLNFFYTLFIKRCILEGWPGWLYVLQRTLAEAMIATELVDRSLRRGPHPARPAA
jgi:glycosyltransferase involved in cell wall biosynthesis